MNILVVLASSIGVVILAFIAIMLLKEFLHTLLNPKYHMAALQATRIIQDGNKGKDVTRAVDNFNESCIFDMSIKRTFEMEADENGLKIGGRYYLYEGRFERRSKTWH